MSKMTRTFKAICILVGLFCSLNSLLPKHDSQVIAKAESVRGVWAATVFSLDYPSKPTTSAEVLRRDADNLLNNVQKLGYNTLFLQVRPSGDAFYKSQIFPWSKHLTGAQGTAPSDNFDPLTYFTEKAHEKGISLHAWINPYRLTSSAKDSDLIDPNSIAAKYPELVVKHTDGKLYLNPVEPDSTALILEGIMEIVKNYDIDGIHLDDYFYPDSSFPDGDTFSKYGGDFSDIGDWRRNNTTNLIRRISTALRAENPNIIFSVSPCGIWANKASHPEGSETTGAQSYFDYYADSRLWVRDNLVDWIMPQIYWNIGHSSADFEALSKWWTETVQGTDVSLIVGQAAYKAAEETGSASVWYSQSGAEELYRQTELLKDLDGFIGYSHYRLGSLLQSSVLRTFATYANTGEMPLFTDLFAFPWAEDAIISLHEKGIINGMGDGTFGGKISISRADFILMLVRLTGKTTTFADNFLDVTPDKYYYTEIGIAKALGFTTGRDGETFDPEGNITREDMATLAYRILKKENKLNFDENISLSAKFSDGHLVSPYAKDAVSALVAQHLLSGYETGEFLPQGFATRAETAVFLNRLSQLF